MKIIKKFEGVEFIKGYNRTCVYDLQRETYNFIPNNITDLINLKIDQTVESFYNDLNKEELEWINFLFSKEYLFKIDSSFKNCFPKIDFEYKTPSIVETCLIDIISFNNKVNLKILEQLNVLNLIFKFDYNKLGDQIVDYVNECLQDLTFNSVNLAINKETINKSELDLLKRKFEEKISSSDSIFFIDMQEEAYFKPSFIVNTQTFIEATMYNTFFHKRMYVNADSEFYFDDENTLYGDLQMVEDKEDIFKIVNTSIEVKNLWLSNKNRTDVCKDCEFRFMCIDKRKPLKRKLKNKHIEYYMPNECMYNPYISKWSNEEDFKSLESCGVKSDSLGFFINDYRIKTLNKNFWS